MRSTRVLAFCGWVLGLLVIPGCTRQFYRTEADREVACVLANKDRVPAWKLEHMHVYPDPRARFADPTNPDRPPMPCDDPAAKLLAPNPQRPGKAGVGHVEGTGYVDLLAQWDAENRGKRLAKLGGEEESQEEPGTKSAPNQTSKKSPSEKMGTEKGDPAKAGLERVEPTKKGETGKDEVGKSEPGKMESGNPGPVLPELGNRPTPFLLDLEQAVELAIFNSREFQDRREDIYLAALPVTRERFAFSAQYYALEQLIRERTGKNVGPFGKGDRWIANTSVGVSKLFSTGALLLVQFANQTVIELTNPANRHTTSVSNLNFDVIQPLLRGGGKAVALEPLTQAERNLLYEIRAYARFRKEYFQYITGAINFNDRSFAAGTGGGVQGGVFLNSPGQTVRPGGAGNIALATFSAPQGGSYLQTLLRSALYRVEQDNVNRVKELENLFINYEAGGEVSALQVGQVQLQLLTGQTNAIQREKDYRDSLDSFKLQLGVPLHLPLELEDESVKPIAKHLERLERTVKDFDETVQGLDRIEASIKPKDLRSTLQKVVNESKATRGAKVFRETFPKRWERWRTEYPDTKKLGEALSILRDERRKLQDLKSDLEEKDLRLTPKDADRLKIVEDEIATGTLETSVRRFEAGTWEKETKEILQQQLRDARWRDVRNSVVLILTEASTERLNTIRPQAPKLPPVVVEGVDILAEDLERCYEIATRQALENRLDLMNARAQLHDAWRQIAIFANGLLGTFNVAYTVTWRPIPRDPTL